MFIVGPLTDNYVVVADRIQNNLFQVSIATGDVRAILSRAPLADHVTYTAVALDTNNQTVYWADATGRVIGKTTFGGSDEIILEDKFGNH